MGQRPHLSRILIVCGTIMVVASLLLVGLQMMLSAEDVHDHRSQASSLLRDSRIERVTLSEWEPPSVAIAWVALAGGFVLIGTGIRKASAIPDSTKSHRIEDFD